MKTVLTENTTDMFRDLTAIERQVLFMESRSNQPISPLKYLELLKIHFKK